MHVANYFLPIYNMVIKKNKNVLNCKQVAFFFLYILNVGDSMDMLDMYLKHAWLLVLSEQYLEKVNGHQLDMGLEIIILYLLIIRRKNYEIL